MYVVMHNNSIYLVLQSNKCRVVRLNSVCIFVVVNFITFLFFRINVSFNELSKKFLLVVYISFEGKKHNDKNYIVVLDSKEMPVQFEQSLLRLLFFHCTPFIWILSRTYAPIWANVMRDIKT